MGVIKVLLSGEPEDVEAATNCLLLNPRTAATRTVVHYRSDNPSCFAASTTLRRFLEIELQEEKQDEENVVQ